MALTGEQAFAEISAYGQRMMRLVETSSEREAAARAAADYFDGLAKAEHASRGLKRANLPVRDEPVRKHPGYWNR